MRVSHLLAEDDKGNRAVSKFIGVLGLPWELGLPSALCQSGVRVLQSGE